MAITLYPYKLLPGELEARLEGGLFLLPGQLLCFEGETRAYGKVIAVRSGLVSPGEKDAALRKLDTTHAALSEDGALVRIRLFYGCPTMAPQSVQLLTDEQMAQAVQREQGAIQEPVCFGEKASGALLLERSHLGPLMLIEGDDFLFKYDALMMAARAVSPYQRVLLVDPLGISVGAVGHSYRHAGRDVRLSLRDVGSKRFLTAFGDLLPESLRELGMRTLASLLPATSEFVGLQALFALESVADAPLRNLILQSLYAAAEAEVFANQPSEALSLAQLISEPVNTVDVSTLPEPWKQLFYEELCLQAFRVAGNLPSPSSQSGSVTARAHRHTAPRMTLALIYPENYLSNLADWVQRAEEANIHLLILSSSRLADSLRAMATNVLTADSSDYALLQGDLTLGMPVKLPLVRMLDERLPVSVVRDDAPEAIVSARKYEPIIVGPESSLPVSDENMVTPLTALSQRPPAEDESLSALSLDDEPPVFDALEPSTLSGGVAPEGASSESLSGFFDELPETSGLSARLARRAYPKSVGPAPVSLGGLPEEPSVAREIGLADEPDEMPYTPLTDGSTMASAASAGSGAESAWVSPTAETATEGDVEDFDFDVNLDASGNESATMSVDAWEWPSAASQNDATSSEAFEALAPSIPLTSGGDESGQVDSLPMEGPQGDAYPTDETVPIYRKVSPAPDSSVAARFEIGEVVIHPTYGRGVVTKVLPMEESVILNITFDSVGKRLLDPSLCQLEREPDQG